MKSFKKHYDTFFLIDKLILAKKTGTPVELAIKLKISDRQVYHYLRCLKKDFKAPLKYDETNCSYIYTQAGSLFGGFSKN